MAAIGCFFNPKLYKAYSCVQIARSTCESVSAALAKPRVQRQSFVAGVLRSAGRRGCVTDTTSSARLDDDSTIELTGATGRTVFDIRARIIKDRAALKGLQEYVLRVCQ